MHSIIFLAVAISMTAFGCKVRPQSELNSISTNDEIFVIATPMTWDDAKASFSLTLDPTKRLGCEAFGGRLPQYDELKPFDKTLPERRSYWTADVDPSDKDRAKTFIPGTGFQRHHAKEQEFWTACLRVVSKELLAQRILNTSVASGKRSNKKLSILPEAMDWYSASAKFDGQVHPDRIPGCEAYGMRLPTFKELTEFAESAQIEGKIGTQYKNYYWSTDESREKNGWAYAIKHPRFDNIPKSQIGRDPNNSEIFKKTDKLQVVCI